MERKYISEDRYKKGTTRKRRNSKTVRTNLKPKTESKVVQKEFPKNKIKKKKGESKVKNIVTCIILLLIIAVISRAILKDENEPFIPLPFITSSNEDIIKIGIITENSLLDSNTSNLVLNELNKYSNDRLLEIKTDYSIEYKCISKIDKVSNKEYILTINDKSKVIAEDIKKQLDDLRINVNSPYYKRLSNIEEIVVVNSNSLNIKLKIDDPYFIYNLDISLTTSKDLVNYIKSDSSNENRLEFVRHKAANKSLPIKVIVTKYKNVYDVVEAYKQHEINMFVTNAENVQNLLGSYQYNMAAYRNGQSIFLFSNPKSKLYEKEEVRQAIAYSIDRDSIIQEILKAKGTKIDLPFIYDEVKYKYDIYAAENLLLTSGYTKSNKVYSKMENGEKIVLELDLIVNKNDELKINIANRIKNNLSSIGIKVNIESLAEDKLQKRIEKGTYDLLLASVNLNNNPDISVFKNNLFIAENVTKAIDTVNNSTIQELNKNVKLLNNELSKQISAIGIYSDVSYLIYSKDIIGMQNISYMNLFSSLLKQSSN